MLKAKTYHSRKQFMNQEHFSKIQDFYESNKKDLFLGTAVFLVGMIGFGLGRLSVLVPDKTPLTITEPPQANRELQAGVGYVSKSGGEVHASKNGSAYYFPWCKNSIKEENKVTFSSEQEATGAGYTLAKNCEK